MLQKLSLLLSLTLLPIFPASAQDVCYMVNSRGETANLDRICGTLAQRSLTPEQLYLMEYKSLAARGSNSGMLLNSANTQPDVTLGLAKEVCRIFREGGDRRDAARGWVRSMRNAPTEEMRDALSEDAAITIVAATKYLCPDQARKIGN